MKAEIVLVREFAYVGKQTFIRLASPRLVILGILVAVVVPAPAFVIAAIRRR